MKYTIKTLIEQQGFNTEQTKYAKSLILDFLLSSKDKYKWIVGSTKLDSQEIFEEIVSLLHCYSMKLYSSRRRMEKIKEAINDVDES